jgi:hypothetical protein
METMDYHHKTSYLSLAVYFNRANYITQFFFVITFEVLPKVLELIPNFFINCGSTSYFLMKYYTSSIYAIALKFPLVL